MRGEPSATPVRFFQREEDDLNSSTSRAASRDVWREARSSGRRTAARWSEPLRRRTSRAVVRKILPRNKLEVELNSNYSAALTVRPLDRRRP